jgi:hypothetical protein
MTDTREEPPTEQSDDKQLNVIQMVLHDMPPWQKSILTFFLIVPIALALSGLILQVNVGSIIQAVINEQLSQNREQTVGSITSTLNQSTASLSEQISVLQRETISGGARLDRLEERTRDILALFTSRIEKIEQKTDELAKSVNDIKIYICDTDGKTRGDCPLLR